MNVDPAVRAAAGESEARLRFVAKRANELAAASAASGVIFHPALGLAAVAAFAGVLSGNLADEQQRLSNDPPRSDFQRRTRSRRRPLHPEVLSQYQAPGAALRSSLETIPLDREAATAFAIAAEGERADTSALVRAFERALAARDAGERMVLGERLAETARFADAAGSAARGVSVRAGQWADALEAEARYLESNLSGFRRKDVRLEEVLSEDVRQALRQAGLPKNALRQASVADISEAPVSQLIVALREASPSAARLATTLAGWEPQANVG